MKNIIKIGLIAFLMMTNINASTIHDLFDTTTKGKSSGGTIDDNQLFDDGLGIITFQGQTGGTTTVSNELKVQKILNDVKNTSTDPLLTANVKSNLLSGNLGTTAQLNEVNLITAQTSGGGAGGSTPQGSISIKCVGEAIGSLHNEGGVDYLVVDNTSLRNLANDFTNQDLEHVCTSNVTDMSKMFYQTFFKVPAQSYYKFNQDISKWDTSNVTSMFQMFYNATSFNQDIGNWDISNVTDISQMFYSSISFNQNIGNWDTSNVTSLYLMFYNAILFNQDIGNWNTINVTDISSMFYGATAFNGDISGWNTGNVSSMYGMFFNASSFNSNISGWNTSNVINMNNMFYGATSFNQDLTGWNVNNVTSYSRFNQGATNLTLIPNF